MTKKIVYVSEDIAFGSFVAIQNSIFSLFELLSNDGYRIVVLTDKESVFKNLNFADEMCTLEDAVRCIDKDNTNIFISHTADDLQQSPLANINIFLMLNNNIEQGKQLEEMGIKVFDNPIAIYEWLKEQ